MVGGVIEGKLLYLGRDLYYYGDMDYSYVLHSAMPLVEKFQVFGFEETGGEYACTKSIEVDGSEFDVVITCKVGTSLTAQVFDKATGDRYSLFDMPGARGAFIGKIREQVQKIIDEFRTVCFTEQDLYEKYISYLASHFCVQPDFPWDDSPDACVFRCPNGKWFALMMKIKYKQLGVGSSDEDVWVVNMKHDADKIPSVVDKHSVFSAWHMNKKHWITVLLTAVTDFKKLCELTQRSFEMVSGKK